MYEDMNKYATQIKNQNIHDVYVGNVEGDNR